MKKDTIYIDVEDDITQVIEKVKASAHQIVAVVLPKRFPVLQSSVNMKLLKKTSNDNGKKIVLITSEKGLLPLAADAGVYVADTLKSRPYIPEQEIDETADDPILDETKPIGVLDGDPEIEEAIEEVEIEEEPSKSKKGKKKSKKNDKPSKEQIKKAGFIASLRAGLKTKGVKKVPNFDKSRKKFILLGIGLVLLVAGWFYLFEVLPTAKIAITAKTTKLPTSLSFSVDPNLEQSNIEESKLKGVSESKKVTVSEEFVPTGEKDVGEKATGTMEIQNCDREEEFTFPAGTTFQDENTGYIYQSTQAATVPAGNIVVTGDGNNCVTPGKTDVPVIATANGESRNLSARSYTLPNYSPGFTGFGSQMSGGTTEIVKVVTQEDVDAAIKKLEEREDTEDLEQLIDSLGEGVFVFSDTFKSESGDPAIKPAVGEESEKATVSIEFTFSIVGAATEDIEKLLQQKHEDLLNSGEQAILDNGIAEAKAKVKETEGKYAVEIDTDSYIGPTIDTIKLADEIANTRYSEAETIIKSKPGVSEVVITPNPWYVYFIPDSDKIEISIEIKEAN